jgi:hypothetical protein
MEIVYTVRIKFRTDPHTTERGDNPERICEVTVDIYGQYLRKAYYGHLPREDDEAALAAIAWERMSRDLIEDGMVVIAELTAEEWGWYAQVQSNLNGKPTENGRFVSADA